MAIKEITNKGAYLADWVAGSKPQADTETHQEKIYDPRFSAGNGSRRMIKPAPTPENIKWDLRPKGPPGNDGAAERQRRILVRLEAANIVIVDDFALEGSGTLVFDSNGKTTEIDVVACEPIPLSEMIPAAVPKPEGFVTPLWKAGTSLFLLGENQPKESQE